MFRQLTDTAKAGLFYALALALAFGCAAAAPLLGERVTLLNMFTSLLAVLLMQLVVTRDGYSRAGWAGLGLHKAGLRAWGLAIALPFLVIAFSYVVVWLSGIAWFAVPADFPGAAGLLIDFLLGFAVVGLTAALAEEIGWRGYLLPRLTSLGQKRALLLSGLLHGIWHLPVMLLTPYYHNVGSPLIVVPLFLATLTFAGVFYGYLRLMTDSIWPVAIAHSALNAFWNIFARFTASASPVALAYLAGEAGLLPLIATAAGAGWLAYLARARTPRVRLAVAPQD
jgi:uncharacterized protein